MVIIILCLSFTSKYVIDWSRYEQTIIEQIEESFGKGSISISSIDGSLLPTPKVELYNLYLNYSSGNKINEVLVIPKVDIEISIFSMLLFNPKIKSLNIASVDFKLNQLIELTSLVVGKRSNIQVMNLDSGKIRLQSSFFRDFSFDKLRIKISDDELLIKGNIIVDDSVYKADMEFNGTSTIFSLKSDFLEAKFLGESKSGSLEIYGTNFASHVGNLAHSISFNNSIWDEFKVEAGISWSENGFDVKALKLFSDSLNMNLNLKRVYSTNYTDFKMLIDYINFDDLLSQQDESSSSLLHFMRYLNGSRGENASGKVLIKADKIKYYENLINNFTIEIDIYEKESNVKQFTFNAPGATEVDIIGKLVNNGIISKFDGTMLVLNKDSKTFLEWLLPIEKLTDGGELMFKSDVIVTPTAFSLYNADLSLGDFVAKSQIFVRSDARSEQIKLELEADNLDLENYVFQEIKDIVGKRLVGARNYEMDFDIDVQNVSYSNNRIDKVAFKMLSSAGKIIIPDINFNSDNLKFSGNASLISKGFDVMVDSNIEIDYLDTKILDLPSILDLDQNPDNPQVNWFSTPFSWFGMDNLSGDISVKIKEMNTNKVLFNDMELDLVLGDKLLSINRLSSGVDDGGHVEANAYVGMESESSSLLSFSLSNLDISVLTKNVFDINSFSEGKFSCAGSVKSKGNNIKDIISNLEGKLEIASRSITIDTFGIDKLFNNVMSVKNNSELATLTKVLIFSGETYLDYLDGSVNIGNGIMASTLKFKTEASTGIVSSHLSLTDFNTNTVVRFYFIDQSNPTKVLSLDMSASGPIWLPKITFDNDKVYTMVVENRKP